MGKRKKAILVVVLVMLGVLIAFIVGIGEKPPLAVWTTNEGVQYKIMAIGRIYFQNKSEHMLTVRYVSKDPTDPQVRQAEFRDMYTMVARKLKIDKFDSVGLEAIVQPSKAFGISHFSGYRDRRLVDEVRRLVAQETPNDDDLSAPQISSQ